MLAHFLAIAVALGSSLFYLAAFFFPEIHRPRDFLWCTVGGFYALVLWICAGRITGGVLLGQTASVALLGWLTWQTLSLRRTKTPVMERTEISDATVETAKSGFGFGSLINRFRPDAAAPNPEAPSPAPSDSSESEASPPAPSAADEPAPPESEASPPAPSAADEPDMSDPPDTPDPPDSEPVAVAPAPEPEPTPPEAMRWDEVIVTEPALLNEDLSQVPEPDVVKDLEALGLIDEPEVEPFQVKDETTAAEPSDEAEDGAADAPPSEESDVVVVKGEVVKDTDPDAWI